MTHFVSKTCNGAKCVCGRSAAHKLGEEIPSDEPCMSCGETWRYPSAGGRREVMDPGPCHDMYHHNRGPHRHNLTSYVCCFHWSLILGSATGCPLGDNDKTTLTEFRRACTDDGNIFAQTIELRCVACRGPLRIETSSPTNTLVGCTACGVGHHVKMKEF